MVLDYVMSQDDRRRLSWEVAIVLEPVCYPHCQTTNGGKNGQSGEGKQRYRCRNTDCARASFILNYRYRGYVLEVKEPVSEMAMSGSGIQV
ncbi:MAG: hypothetical protein ACFBSG_08030 [Leptolyngbyaceae cyanobacterium]